MFKIQDKLKNNGKIISIPHELISLNPFSARRESAEDNIYTLACSLRENGMIQPINVRPHGGKYQVIAGERRLRAARIAGIMLIPCIIMDISDENMASFAFCENFQRSRLTFFEEAEALNAIMGRFNFTAEEFAEKIGSDAEIISYKLQILKLPQDIRDLARDEGLSETQVHTLLKLKNHKQREDAILQIGKEKLNEKQTEALIREILYSQECEDKSAHKKIFKDTRIFANSIEKTIEVMNESGIDFVQTKKETDTFIEYTIKILKAPSTPKKTAKRVSVKAARQTHPL